MLRLPRGRFAHFAGPALLCLVLSTIITGARAAEIWFAPFMPRPDVAERLRKNPGDEVAFLHQLDLAQQGWDALFQAPLPGALVPPMQVFTISANAALGIPDQQLKTRLDALATRRVLIALMILPVVVSGEACGHTEGYSDIRSLNAVIAKLKRLAITPHYLAMDGGLWFGHYARGGHECRFGLDETIARVSSAVKLFAIAFPGIVVGDIEPTVPLTTEPDWRDSLRRYRDGIKVATGKALDFLQLDIAWPLPTWKQSVADETALARSLGMRIGYIYDGVKQDRSDSAWLTRARNDMAEAEGGLGLRPDEAIMASWNEHPKLSVSMPLDNSLASLMPYYAQPLVRIELAHEGAILGRVIKEDGLPAAGFAVHALVAGGGNLHGAVPDVSIDGTVPERARSAVLSLHLNRDCFCAGPNDLLIGHLRYVEGGSAAQTLDLAGSLRRSGQAVTADSAASDNLIRLTTSAAQPLWAATAAFTTHGGATYRLTAEVRDLLASPANGYLGLLWRDDAGRRLSEEIIRVVPDFQPIQAMTTDAEGRFSIHDSSWKKESALVRIYVPDQKGHRAAALEVPVQPSRQ
jgi:hypothetical protein